MSDSDSAVRAWYTSHFATTDLGYKCFDWRLLNVAPMIHGRDVLNCGCGFPLDEMALAPMTRRWVTVDFTPAVIDKCRALVPNLPVEWLLADFRALPLEDEDFDTVLDFSSGDHVAERREQMRAEAFRVLRPGGYYVVTYANRAFFQDGREDAYGDFGYEKRQSPEELLSELSAAGFLDVVCRDDSSARSGVVVRKP